MTNEELIAKIKAEIEKRITDNTFGAKLELIDILAWLDTLESEKPMNPDLEKELARFYLKDLCGSEKDEIPEATLHHNFPIMWDDLRDIARHFAEWGYLRAAEKYNEVEYNRQRAEESAPNDLEKAARKSAVAPFNLDVDEEHLYEYPYLPIAEQKFIEGAKWQKEQDEKEQADLFTIVALDAAQRAKEQMLKEAVEGKIIFLLNGDVAVNIGDTDEYKLGQKVRIIIVKED